MAAYLVAGMLGGVVVQRVGGPDIFGVAVLWPGVLALLLVHLVMLRVFEHGAPFSFVGLGRSNASPALLSGGFLIGMLAIGVPSAILLLIRQLEIVPAPAGSWWDAAARATLYLLPAAFVEELFLRGYIFRVLREAVGWKWTLIGTSITFGLLHLNNPGAGPESTFLVIIAGFFLGTIVLVTNSLYAAWMAHFAWNWTMAVLMHTAVSGIGVVTSDYQVIDNGPDWLTGGAWGPEGGFAAGASMLVCTLLLYTRYLKRADGRTHGKRTLTT
jgi:uncharacterized protein